MKMRFQSRRRSGAAFLLLVVLVLLVVLAAVRTMVKAEVASRRSEAQRQRVRMMIAAIDAAKPIFDDDPKGSLETIELPVTKTERIVVSINDEKTKVTAVWFRGDRPFDDVTHAVLTNKPTQEDEE